jgi:hypothetical protein
MNEISVNSARINHFITQFQEKSTKPVFFLFYSRLKEIGGQNVRFHLSEMQGISQSG